MTKYVVWIKEDGKWVENGDGPMTQREADRICKDLRRELGTRCNYWPVDFDPNPIPV